MRVATGTTTSCTVLDRVPCQTRPCQNQGQCQDNSDGTYDCNCPPPFTGFTCDESPGCEPISPCFNQAVCINELDNKYTCDCTDNYTGQNCDVSLFCNSNPCINEATCVQEGSAGFSCNCHLGFHGPTCADHVCAMNDCENEARCVASENSTHAYFCQCQPGYVGEFCDEEATTCAARPCLNDAECTDVEPEGYMCKCLYGFTGRQCQHPPDVAGITHDSNLGMAMVVILTSVGFVGVLALVVCGFLTKKEMLKITRQEYVYGLPAASGLAKTCTAIGRVCKICLFCKGTTPGAAGYEDEALMEGYDYGDYTDYEGYEDKEAYAKTKKEKRRKSRRVSKKHAAEAYANPPRPRVNSNITNSSQQTITAGSSDWRAYPRRGSGDSTRLSSELKSTPSDQTASTSHSEHHAVTFNLTDEKFSISKFGHT